MIDLAAANHTGRELELMLAGRKPLAMFYAAVSELPDERLIPERAFSPFVDNGLFVQSGLVLSLGPHPVTKRPIEIKYIFYSLKSEQWRISALSLLKRASVVGGWNQTCERVEIALLGYTDEEINAWCAARFRNA